MQNSFFILLAAFFIIFGYYTAIMVMRSGEISFISTFRYSAILFALIIGFFLFEETPDINAAFGIFVIIVSGVVLLYRNEKKNRASNQ